MGREFGASKMHFGPPVTWTADSSGAVGLLLLNVEFFEFDPVLYIAW